MLVASSISAEIFRGGQNNRYCFIGLPHLLTPADPYKMPSLEKYIGLSSATTMDSKESQPSNESSSISSTPAGITIDVTLRHP